MGWVKATQLCELLFFLIMQSIQAKPRKDDDAKHIAFSYNDAWLQNRRKM
jgi:hypothetical protein